MHSRCTDLPDASSCPPASLPLYRPASAAPPRPARRRGGRLLPARHRRRLQVLCEARLGWLFDRGGRLGAAGVDSALSAAPCSSAVPSGWPCARPLAHVERALPNTLRRCATCSRSTRAETSPSRRPAPPSASAPAAQRLPPAGRRRAPAPPVRTLGARCLPLALERAARPPPPSSTHAHLSPLRTRHAFRPPTRGAGTGAWT